MAAYEDKDSSPSSTDMLGSTLQSGADRTFPSYVLLPLFRSSPTDHNHRKSLINALRKDKSAPVPDVLNETFHDVDMSLSRLSEESDGKMHSGCTAVTAFLRLEDENGEQSFLPPDFELVAPRIPSGEHSDEATKQSKGTTGKFLHAIYSNDSSSHSSSGHSDSSSQSSSDKVVVTPANVRRVLYCANAGDARGVLCRAGKAVRLTYDHKGSDKQEAKRITDAGGFVMSGRVNGVLAVTRSLGDSSMKDFVVGAPYTTETEFNDYDEFLILACDGVSATNTSMWTFMLNWHRSYGTLLATKTLWTSCAVFPTPRKPLRNCSSMHTRSTRQTMSPSSSYASGTPQRCFVQIDGGFPEVRRS